ncbi:MAG: hypoxanthine phosphoribosyltransferase [Clostridiaceae bacterium]|jgi:hypoxanthine phosphoribosyltransferase|nr:hypoxanthine phosphoribosyltransferase [Oscillospiraceae bacterium]NLO61848.1 hypoxanthine phosphoribosyltransferase [Clostridiaceae bacterium]
MAYVLGRVLISKDKIDKMVAGLAERISRDYGEEELIVVGILKGSFIFMADLIRLLRPQVIIDFMSVSSYYENTRSTGIVKIIKDMDVNINGKHVLIVEDIVDSGLTLSNLKELLMTKEPKSLKVCVAFDKPDRRKTEIEADYVGMIIPDEFIVGYGLDYAGKYRNLSDIRIMEPDGGIK